MTPMAATYFDQLREEAPAAQLEHLVSGSWISQAIGVAAELGIADLLTDGPQSVAKLAEHTGSHPRALYRLLRALAGIGVFSEVEPECFELTPMAEPLRADAPRSVRDRVRLHI